MRKGTIAIVKVFLESLKNRMKRRHHLDPWLQRDMFRQNHRPLRLIEVEDDDTGETEQFEIEYHNENVFSAYLRDPNGFLVTVLHKAQIEMNEDRPDDLIVRTESETYKVDFYMDHKDNVIQLDYEGAPLKLVSTYFEA